jgi:hypothetical protein
MKPFYYIDYTLPKKELKVGLGYAIAMQIERLVRFAKAGSEIELTCIVRRPILLFWSEYVVFFKVTEP